MLSHKYTRDRLGSYLYFHCASFMDNYGVLHNLFSLQSLYDVSICITLFLRVDMYDPMRQTAIVVIWDWC
jgi:hypothetical protein